ncbi:RHS repeat-associated core domain-containing protein, partial [Roseateles sp.]|uniref:RHS repeat-associated core domain-containing protein n=1 Tax=Roseateles sp. TaxID=1971397 RepID=UPI0031E47198
VATSSYGATPVYSCPSGYSLSGTQCNGTTQQAAAATPDCKGKGALQPAGWCLMRSIIVMPGEDPPRTVCENIAIGMGLAFFNLTSAGRANAYNCYIGPAYNYSCPSGGTLSGQVCVSPSTVAATLSSYSCPSGGSVSGSSCVVTSTSAASVSYSCPAGQAVSGSSCVATNTETQGASPVYACDAGYTLSGSTCSTVVSSAATPVYSCSQGFTLSGTQCTSSTTTTVAATPNYSCPSGQALSGSTCTATNTAAASPIYGCPNGGSLQGQQCVGGGGPTSQTKFVYLGTKLLAEQDTVAGIAYTHTDMLGSPVARSQGVAGGGSITNTRFEPYGAVTQGFTPNQPYISGFTGHVQDGRSGLVYMQQRYYDSLAGRFLSIDPKATSIEAGDGFGRYEYTYSNPYKAIDPDGRAPIDFAAGANAPGYQWVAPMAGLRDVFNDAQIGAKAAAISAATKLANTSVNDFAQRSQSVKFTFSYAALEASYGVSLYESNDLGTLYVGIRSSPGYLLQVSGDDQFKVGSMEGLTLKASAALGTGGIGGASVSAAASTSPRSVGASVGWGVAGRGPTGFSLGLSPPNIGVGLTYKIGWQGTTGSHIKQRVLEAVESK